MKQIKYIIILLVFLFCTNCEKMGKYAIIINNSSQYQVVFYGQFSYPDTMLSVLKPKFKKIGPSEYRDLFDSDIEDPKFNRLKSGEILSLFFISADTLNKYDWSEIRKNYKILKRTELTHEKLSNTNYIVDYP